MHVKNIKLINFRNYDKLDISLNEKLNIFLGENAQGKTNLLESVYMASVGKSYKNSRDKDIINLKKDKAYIGIEVETERGIRFIEVKLEKDKQKRIRVNKLELEKNSELFGNLNVVIFSPEDLKLIKEGPIERRVFLDTEISQINPRYRRNLQNYNKILFQRNKLLKICQKNSRYKETIEPWDAQMSKIGSEIILERINFIDKLSKISKEIHKNISGGREVLCIKYLPSFEVRDMDLNNLQQKFLKLLKSSLEKDIERGSTSYGVHKDDIDIVIDEKSCRLFGSQGQQRTAALSLKLAEVELIKLEIGEYPVMLLDDVLSELDFNRRKQLISTFKNVQTIITSTEDIEINDLKESDKSIFLIKNGKILNEKR